MEKIDFSIKGALVLGILGFVLGLIIVATGVFSMIPHLEYIGLLLGFLYGGFVKEKTA
jgi:hypothetical protein